MTEKRALPVSAKHREFTIKVNGKVVPREHPLNAVRITKQIGRIASARIVYLDGDAASGKFPISSSDLFAPGAEIEIAAGADDDRTTLFRGIAIGQSVRVRSNTASLVSVECRHAAVRLSTAPRSKSFLDQSDKDVIDALLASAGVQGDVEDTGATHAHLVQHRATGWDFLVARARANGLIVLTNGAKVEVKKPVLSGDAALTLTYGATILEFDAEVDARTQLGALSAVTWDPAKQALATSDATAPATKGLGNFEPDELAKAAGLSAAQLVHCALPEGEAKDWANAAWLHSRLDKVRGRVKCVGIGRVEPGALVQLEGVGERYRGKAFVTGVRHDFDTVQGWKTNLQFGGLDDAFGEPATRAALVPRAQGLQIGVVTSLEDPSGEHRVRVSLPLVDASDGVWARVAALDAGNERGFFFRPEIGDEVVVGFFEDDPRAAVLLGCLHSSKHAAPLGAKDANPTKLYQSREKLVLRFDDEQKQLALETPAGNKLLLDESEKSLTLADQHGNKLVMSSSGIAIESASALQVKAKTTLALQAGASFELKSDAALKLEGGASLDLQSKAMTSIKGSLVTIN